MTTCYLSPVFGVGYQALNNQGVVASGALLNTYLAGSVNTPQPTYTDATGATPLSNPIVFNSAGRPTTEIWIPAGVGVKFVLTDSLGVVLGSWDNVTGLNDPLAIGAITGEWTPLGLTPTYVSAVSFTVIGNVVATLTPFRRVKMSVNGGLVYGYVSSITPPVYSNPTTTVTVVNDGGVSLNNTLSAVSYGFLNSSSPSIPATFPGVVNITVGTGVALNANSVTSNQNYIMIQNPQANINVGVEGAAGGNIIVGNTAYFGAVMSSIGLSLAGNGGLAPQIQLTSNLINLLSALQLATTTISAATFNYATLPNNIILINNFAGTVTLTLPSAAGLQAGRVLLVTNSVAQLLNSASANVVPLAGGAAGTAILANTIGKWAILATTSIDTNWHIIAGN